MNTTLKALAAAALAMSLADAQATLAGPSTLDYLGQVSIKGNLDTGPGEAYLYSASGSWSTLNPDNCSTAYPYTYDASTAAGKAVHATVLAASLGGRQVKLYIDGCLNNKPKVVRVDMWRAD